MRTEYVAAFIALQLATAGLAQAPQLPPLSVSERLSRGFMVPAAVLLRATTPAEDEAHAIWTMRAALNVAALQCQFSPFLRTVKNYNEALRHHATELTRAQAVMVGHFKRYDRAQALNSFDQYTTRTYNSFSTLDAQYNFCDAAGTIGREVLRLKRGSLGQSALVLNPVMRASLSKQPDRILFDPGQVAWTWLPPIPDVEPENRKGRRKR